MQQTGQINNICLLELVNKKTIRILDVWYSKTCLKRPLKNRWNKGLKDNGSLMKVESIVECSLGAFCNTFDLHSAITGLETNFWSSFWVAA